MLDLFRAYEIPLAVLVNSEIYEHCPEVMDAFRARGDEVVGHGRANARNVRAYCLRRKKTALIRRSTAILSDHEGRAPRGWLALGSPRVL